jgi:ADP-heptose:LPS heptosyltransferase
MRVFYLENTEWNKKDTTLEGKVDLGHRSVEKLTANRLYICSKLDLELLSLAAKDANTNSLKVITLDTQNKLITENKVINLLGTHTSEKEIYDFDDFVEKFELGAVIKICLITPFGNALGDNVIFFSVVSELQRRVINSRKNIEFHLVTVSTSDSVEKLLRNSNLFASINYLPYPLEDLNQFDGCIDFIRNHLHSEKTWVDSLFELCGIKPETVLAKNKKYSITPNYEVLRYVSEFFFKLKQEKNKPIIIFNQEASTQIRSIPLFAYRTLLSEMSEISDYHFISLRPIDFKHPCFTNLSHLSVDVDHYIALVSLADAFITVDTSLYHFADAVGTPGVTIFTTSEPFRFATYYHSIKSIQLEGADKLGTIYWSNDQKDIDFVNSLWSSMDAKTLINLLNAVM